MDFFNFGRDQLEMMVTPTQNKRNDKIIKYPLVTISSWKSLMCESCNMNKEANSKWWQTFLTKF